MNLKKYAVIVAATVMTFAGQHVATAQVPFDDANLPGGSPAVVEDGPGEVVAGYRAGGPCQLVVWPVGWDRNSNWLGVRGGRENCGNNASYTVELRKHRRLRKDDHLATARGEWNSTVVAYAACRGSGSYFGKVLSSTGNTREGARSNVCR